jgi:hypothetical protein
LAKLAVRIKARAARSLSDPTIRIPAERQGLSMYLSVSKRAGTAERSTYFAYGEGNIERLSIDETRVKDETRPTN